MEALKVKSTEIGTTIPTSSEGDSPGGVGASALAPRSTAQVSEIELTLGRDGRLWLHNDGGSKKAVSVTRCFPWSEPLEWLSLRDEDGEEAALVESMAKLSAHSREAMLAALHEAAFVFRIEAIHSIVEEFELRQWEVQLKEGKRKFQTKLNAWPRDLPSGGVLIQDIANDLYLIPDLDALDGKSAKMLFAFLDD